MKIALVSAGIMPVPPPGWGGLEQFVWDTYQDLIKLGAEVDIINTPDRREIINKVNGGGYDAAHIHYDQFYDILPELLVPVKIISSHYPYLNIESQWDRDGFTSTFMGIVNASDTRVFASSPQDIATYKKWGVEDARLYHSKLGIQSNKYEFFEKPSRSTLCLGKITPRKRQVKLQSFPMIDFIGPMGDPNFINHDRYLGEMSRDELNKTISLYSNLILLSEGENATPLVIKEGLVCGLGAIVSECCALELDRNLPFISVVPDHLLSDLSCIQDILFDNREASLLYREEIRQYGIAQFDSLQFTRNYLEQIKSYL